MNAVDGAEREEQQKSLERSRDVSGKLPKDSRFQTTSI